MTGIGGYNYLGAWGGVVTQTINHTGIQGTFTPDLQSLISRNWALEEEIGKLKVEIETLKAANLRLDQIISA